MMRNEKFPLTINAAPHSRFWIVGSMLLPIVMALLMQFVTSPVASAQMGGGMGGGPGGAPAAVPDEKFIDKVRRDGIMARRNPRSGKVITAVQIVGNQLVPTTKIYAQIQTRKDRFFSKEIALADVRRLYYMQSFENVTFKTQEHPGGVVVQFIVREKPLVTRVEYHGNYAVGETELIGRTDINPGDPINDRMIENARRRIRDYYFEKGFYTATIQALPPDERGTVVFRICEGPKERIRSLRFIGNTIVSTSRLEKIIKSRGPLLYVLYYAGNGADRAKIHSDKDLLEAYYHNLGYMRAQVDWIPKYDESGKWLDLTFVIDEGPLFTVTDVQIEGNVYVETQSLYDRITLKAGDAFNGTVMNQDVQSILYGYGDLGYLYADLKPKTYMNSDSNSVSLVYKIDEGERVRIGDIKIQIEGDPDRIHETAILNQLGIVEGQLLSRRIVERSEAVLMRLPLLETNPTIAPAPEFKIVPRDY